VQVLRDTWKWDGFVVSDYDAWAEVWGTHKEGGSAEGGAAKGLNAGIGASGQRESRSDLHTILYCF
jgi:beta-glucosidase